MTPHAFDVIPKGIFMTQQVGLWRGGPDWWSGMAD